MNPVVAILAPRVRPAGRRRRGFTIMETALTTVIIGVGVVALLQLLATGTNVNNSAAEMTTAVNLANNVHEIMAGLPLYDPNYPGTFNPGLANVANFAGVTEFDGSTFKPPLDNTRGQMTGAGLDNWSQQVTVQSVNEDNLNAVVTNSTTQNAARVTVKVFHNTSQVYQTSWVATNRVGG